MTTAQHTAQLEAGLAALGLAVSAELRARLLAYLDLLRKWNKVYRLTAITAPQKMVSHHLLDSVAVLAPIAARLEGVAAPRLLDVGSGGGQPGIPLAILRPDWGFTLLDSSHKKTTFLRQAAIELGLSNVEVVCGRVEAWQPEVGYDLITSRAFADLGDFVRLTRHALRPGGVWAALKGVQPFEEIAALPANVRVLAHPAIHVPGLEAERCLVWMEPA